MSQIFDEVKQKSPLTMSEVISIADKNNVTVTDIVLQETVVRTGKTNEEIFKEVLKEYEHNLNAIDIGTTTGKSILFGTTGKQLIEKEAKLFEDEFINDVLIYTISAQIGNHSIGLRPCAGTGDSCPYTGLVKAMKKHGYPREKIAKIGSLLLKIGSLYRVGKVTTGCNMEGFGAGSAAIAAAMVELKGGSPKDMERAMVLAISPTIANPCTPRVMVPGLCSTHIGGAVLIGTLAAGLAVNTDIEVNVPFDVMFAMASEVHKVSAIHVVPKVIDFMQPFFKTKAAVEKLIDVEIKEKEEKKVEETIKAANEIAKGIATNSQPVTSVLGEAVVGGSSQAVGSPTNTARIAHFLTKGKIKKIIIELYPELFARRGINIPGMLMAAAFGTSTSDYKKYNEAVALVQEMGIEVEIKEVDEYQLQKVTIEAEEQNAMVDSLNRGGGRLVLRDAYPSYQEAEKVANELGIVIVK